MFTCGTLFGYNTIIVRPTLFEEINMPDDGHEKTTARILIAEDEMILAEDLGLSLEKLGYVVTGKVSTGEEAVKFAKDLSPELILMDIKLKGAMDGIEAADHIRACLNIPVVYLTGYGEKDILNRAKLTEPYGYLGKPCTFQELRNTIETVLYKHKADKRVRESEERYRSLVEQSIDGIAVVQGTTVRFVNPALARMFGYQSEREMEGQNFLTFVAPEYRELMEKRGLEREKGESVSSYYEFTALKMDGTPFAAELRVGLISYNGENARQAVIRDISERIMVVEGLRHSRNEFRQREKDRTKELGAITEALEASQSTLRLITDSLPVLITYIDSEQRYRLCNKTYELWRGVPRREIEGRHLKEVLGAAAYEGAREYVEAALSGSPVDYEMTATYQDGKERRLHAIYVPHVDETGDIKGFAGLITDITERQVMEEGLRNARDDLEQRVAERTADLVAANKKLKQEIACRQNMEEALHESEEKYRLLYETMMDAFVSVDMTGRIHETNQAYQAMLGYSQDELRKLTYVDLTPEKWHDFEARIVEEQILVKGYSDVYCKEYRKKDGTVFPIELRTFLIRNKTGQPSFMWAIVRDITERTRAEERIKASLREKEALLREIHHRVKNNLAVMQSLFRIQSHHAQNQDLCRMLETTQHRIRSMALAHELLYQSENMTDINIRRYLHNLLQQLMASFAVIGKSIKLRKQIEEVALSIDTAIPLGFILTELISNCYQHAFSENRFGEIAVSLRCLGNNDLELVVRDDGVGLSEDMDIEESSSLGYHLIRIFVKQLNGEIAILRQKGTKVRVNFPVT